MRHKLRGSPLSAVQRIKHATQASPQDSLSVGIQGNSLQTPLSPTAVVCGGTHEGRRVKTVDDLEVCGAPPIPPLYALDPSAGLPRKIIEELLQKPLQHVSKSWKGSDPG